PPQPGSYRVAVWTGREMDTSRDAEYRLHLSLSVDARGAASPASSAAMLLDELQRTLPEAKRLQKLPDDYEDVCTGRLAGFKRRVKQKLLNNFKQAYVDVLSRQQSQVNGHLILALQQLGECWAALDHSVRGLQQRLDRLEAKVDGLTETRRTPL